MLSIATSPPGAHPEPLHRLELDRTGRSLSYVMARYRLGIRYLIPWGEVALHKEVGGTEREAVYDWLREDFERRSHFPSGVSEAH